MNYCNNFINDFVEKVVEKNCDCCINLKKLCKLSSDNNRDFIYIDKRVRSFLLNQYKTEFLINNEEDVLVLISTALCYLHELNIEDFFYSCDTLSNNEHFHNLCYLIETHLPCIGSELDNWVVDKNKWLDEMPFQTGVYRITEIGDKDKDTFLPFLDWMTQYMFTDRYFFDVLENAEDKVLEDDLGLVNEPDLAALNSIE